jgi:transcriptional regulator with XRE-family HTH domain
MRSEFGKRLVQAREDAGLSQEELCRLAGMAQSTLATAESSGSGSRNTAQLARACGVSAYWLATGEGKATESADARDVAERFDTLPMATEQQLYMRQRAYMLCLAAIAFAADLPEPPTAPAQPADPQPTEVPLLSWRKRT